jgi:hypothetical protein
MILMIEDEPRVPVVGEYFLSTMREDIITRANVPGLSPKRIISMVAVPVENAGNGNQIFIPTADYLVGRATGRYQ